MQRGLVGFVLGSYRTSLKDIKRYAGHNKWSNIKHDKARIDKVRALLFQEYRRKMRAAVLEGGGPDPNRNSKLASVIEQAKKFNMPVASINSYMEKLSSSDFKNSCIEVRGPGNSSLVIQCQVTNINLFKNELQSVLKKYGCKVDPTIKSQYNHKGLVIAQKDCSLDSATEDAINASVEDVEETTVDGKQTFLFNCHPTFVDKIAESLQKNGYTILSAGEEYTPHNTVVLNQDNLTLIGNLCERIYKTFGEQVIKINDNIDYSEEVESTT